MGGVFYKQANTLPVFCLYLFTKLHICDKMVKDTTFYV